MKKTLLVLASLGFLNFGCTTTKCCDNPTPTPVVTTVTTASTLTDADGLPLKKISMEWKNVDAKTVLKALFEENKVKYDFAPNLKKRSISKSVENIEWREALNQVTASAGYDYSVDNGTVHVVNGMGKGAPQKAPSKAAKKAKNI